MQKSCRQIIVRLVIKLTNAMFACSFVRSCQVKRDVRNMNLLTAPGLLEMIS